MKHGKCERCDAITWLEEHHIFPQSIFKGKGETIYLCPTCHNELHVHMGQIKSKNKGFYRSFHLSWLWRMFIVATIISLTYLIS